jgi:hypothetical protein
MTTMMDIIFAIILGAAVLLIILNANATLREVWSVYNGDVMVQTALVSNAQIIEGEFRNMGVGVASASDSTIVIAMDTCIQFRRRMRPENANVDTIKYYSGSTSELTATNNQADRFLYRQVNSDQPQRVGIVTQFRLRYFKNGGDELTTPVNPSELFNIRIIEVTLYVQSPNAIYRDPSTVKPGEQDALYSTGLWKQTRLASQNLKR